MTIPSRSSGSISENPKKLATRKALTVNAGCQKYSSLKMAARAGNMSVIFPETPIAHGMTEGVVPERICS